MLEKAVIKVLAFFNLFNFPLNFEEIFESLEESCQKKELAAALENLVNKNLIFKKNDFYFLPSREKILKIRQERKQHAQRKFKRAQRISSIFKCLPWVKMIAVGNIIGENNLADHSDIDFFIVTSARRIWLTRFCLTAFTKILGLRPRLNNTRDKICLSFFASEDALNLDKLRLKEDPYFTYWLLGLKIFYAKSDLYNRFLAANFWAAQALPNWNKLKNLALQNSNYNKINKNRLLDFLELKFKNFQLKRLPIALKQKMKSGKEVVINDQVLKFHSNDRRLNFLAKWQADLRKLKIN